MDVLCFLLDSVFGLYQYIKCFWELVLAPFNSMKCDAKVNGSRLSYLPINDSLRANGAHDVCVGAVGYHTSLHYGLSFLAPALQGIRAKKPHSFIDEVKVSIISLSNYCGVSLMALLDYTAYPLIGLETEMFA